MHNLVDMYLNIVHIIMVNKANGAIINMAQDFLGSNNINLLIPMVNLVQDCKVER